MEAQRPLAGYEEIPHTADWALRVWAPDLPALFREAAAGMYALAGVILAEEGAVERSLALSAPDGEALLVAFLSELVYLAEQERLAFDTVEPVITVDAQGYRLQARLHGAPIRSLMKTIKAVTFHNLQIRPTPQGLETEIIFDV